MEVKTVSFTSTSGGMRIGKVDLTPRLVKL